MSTSTRPTQNVIPPSSMFVLRLLDVDNRPVIDASVSAASGDACADTIPITRTANQYSFAIPSSSKVCVRIEHPRFEPQTMELDLRVLPNGFTLHLGEPGAIYAYGNGVHDAIKVWPRMLGVRLGAYGHLDSVRALLNSLGLAAGKVAGGQILLAHADHDISYDNSPELEKLRASPLIAWAGPVLAYSDRHFSGVSGEFQVRVDANNERAFVADVGSMKEVRSLLRWRALGEYRIIFQPRIGYGVYPLMEGIAKKYSLRDVVANSVSITDNTPTSDDTRLPHDVNIPDR